MKKIIMMGMLLVSLFLLSGCGVTYGPGETGLSDEGKCMLVISKIICEEKGLTHIGYKPIPDNAICSDGRFIEIEFDISMEATNKCIEILENTSMESLYEEVKEQ